MRTRAFLLILLLTLLSVPSLTFAQSNFGAFTALSGLSIDCETFADGDRPRFRENVLFTHRGLSGPSILQISNQLQPKEPFRINLLPGVDALELLRDDEVLSVRTMAG